MSIWKQDGSFKMKCHYIYDKIAGRVLIPGCWGVANDYPNMKSCTCRDAPPETFEEFEKQSYNEKVNELITKSREMEKEVHRLNRIIRKLLQP